MRAGKKGSWTFSLMFFTVHTPRNIKTSPRGVNPAEESDRAPACSKYDNTLLALHADTSRSKPSIVSHTPTNCCGVVERRANVCCCCRNSEHTHNIMIARWQLVTQPSMAARTERSCYISAEEMTRCWDRVNL